MQVAMSAATHSSRPLSVRVSREKECADNSIVEPMSPTGRVMEELGVCIVVVIGLGTPVNLPVFRAGIETELLTRFPRFRSIQVILQTLFVSFPPSQNNCRGFSSNYNNLGNLLRI